MKWREISEKMRHCAGWSKRWVCCVALGRVASYLEILHEIVKYSKAFWVLAVLDVYQGADLCGLAKKDVDQIIESRKGKARHLESDVIISNTYLQLLFSNDIFFGPICVVFSERLWTQWQCDEDTAYALCNFTGFYYPFELLHEQRANPHCCMRVNETINSDLRRVRTLFAYQTIVAIIGVVGVSKTAMGVFKFKKFMSMFARMASARKARQVSTWTNAEQTHSLVSTRNGLTQVVVEKRNTCLR